MSLKKRIFVALAQFESRLAAKWAAKSHKRLLKAQWNYPPQPEHFDHHIDMYYSMPEKLNSFWVERGVFSGLSLRNGRVLELACGDGYFAKHFFSTRSKSITAVDFDPDAIETAQRKNTAANVKFVLADIRSDMPEGPYENIVWDAAIEHFTPDEIAQLMVDIKQRLTPDGVLSGYTIVERADGTKQLSHHEYEFQGIEDLERFIRPHFTNVRVFETKHPERHNLYFWASDGEIPFGPN